MSGKCSSGANEQRPRAGQQKRLKASDPARETQSTIPLRQRNSNFQVFQQTARTFKGVTYDLNIATTRMESIFGEFHVALDKYKLACEQICTLAERKSADGTRGDPQAVAL